MRRGGVCYNRAVPEWSAAMSVPSLAQRVAQVRADPAVSGWSGAEPLLALMDALVVQLGQVQDEQARQQAEIAQLREQNRELRRQLDRHSDNSGQPPSQDGPRHRPRRPRRRAQGRVRGGQPGHPGRTLRAVPAVRVDQVEAHRPPRCDRCRACLPCGRSVRTVRRQVHDRPAPAPLRVPEHRAHVVACPDCGRRTRAAFPATVAGPVQYGPRMAALVACLRYARHLPVARLARLLRELHGVALSTGTVETLCRRVAQHNRARLARLRDRALALPVACMDETGLRLADGTTWLHVLCNADLTLYRLGGRGEVWTDYAGVAVHDRFAAYWTRQPQVIAHALCNAHLLRNLQEIVELEEEPNGWAARLQRLLHEARRCARGFRMVTGGPVSPRRRQRLTAVWDAILQPALDRYERLPPRHKGKRRGHNPALALSRHRDACLRFLTDPAIPFSNNLAEQALRMMRLQMKISGCFRTVEGARRFADLRSLIETDRKQGRDSLAGLLPTALPP